MNTNQMIRNTQFLLFLSSIFILSSCSKEETPIPELGKWTLVEQFKKEKNGDFKWIDVDEDFQQIEFFGDTNFTSTSYIFECLVGILLPTKTYSNETNTITIEGSDCGTNIFSYYIQDEFLFVVPTWDELYKEKYVKM